MNNEHKNPMISVVMSVYNAEKYLDEAIQSILNQTYKDFEFIIINDGSTDKSLEIIEKYKNHDERIVLISRENKGLIASLNEGIEKAQGKYLARMDADDISLPKRFERQIELLEKDNIDICGCHFFIVDSRSKYKSAKVISTDCVFNTIVLSRSVPFAHASVMFKKEFLINNGLKYGQTKYIHAEDYALWITFSNKNAKISNVDDFLFKYRDSDGTMSKNKINYIDALKLSKLYIMENNDKLFETVKQYENSFNTLNDFEKEQLSYFLIKTIFKGNLFLKLKYIKLLPNAINIINFIRVICGR